MVYPRQRLYDVNHKAFANAVLRGGVNAIGEDRDEAAIEAGFLEVFKRYTGIDNVVPLSRGRLAGYFGVKHSVTTTRRKVVMSPFTIFDLVNMVRVAGGEPVFIDSEPGGVHLSRRAIEEAIDDETAAVIVTHYHSTNREIESIADLCRTRGVKLIEDCAISLGGRVNGTHVGAFGDFALFSFGLFKFVSTYFGGAMSVRDPDVRADIEREIAGWPRMEAADLAPYAKKGLKLSFLTQASVFDRFTFPVFRYGYLKNIAFIRANAQNDPDPFLRESFPDDFKRRPSLFQLREFIRQLPLVELDRQSRIKNAARYYNNLKTANIFGLPDEPNMNVDCYLNFPILLNADRERFVCEMMKSGFDLAIYYYRNCAEIDAFSQYCRPLPNISSFVRNMVFFPVYPKVDSAYIDRLTDRAVELLG